MLGRKSIQGCYIALIVSGIYFKFLIPAFPDVTHMHGHEDKYIYMFSNLISSLTSE